MNYKDLNNLPLSELISLTLREKGNSPVVDELLRKFPSMRDLSEATVNELTSIKGLGPTRANTIMASIELGKRLYNTQAPEIKTIRSPKDVADLLMNDMRHLDREHFRVILLNTKNHVLRIETVSVGNLNSSTVHPRELFKSAIKYSAAAVILVHNHPSGDPSLSREDIEVTNRLVEAGKLLGIEILDHIIIGDGTFISLKEKGLL